MTKEEAIKILNTVLFFGKCDCLKEEIEECLKMAIKALEQEPREDEVILTRKEYGELVSSEYDHGYEKGYMEALEQQEPVLDKIEEEIKDTLYVDSLIFTELIDFKNGKIDADDVIEEFNRVTRMEVLKIIDKYRAESEEEK